MRFQIISSQSEIIIRCEEKKDSLPEVPSRDVLSGEESDVSVDGSLTTVSQSINN